MRGVKLFGRNLASIEAEIDHWFSKGVGGLNLQEQVRVISLARRYEVAADDATHWTDLLLAAIRDLGLIPKWTGHANLDRESHDVSRTIPRVRTG